MNMDYRNMSDEELVDAYFDIGWDFINPVLFRHIVARRLLHVVDAGRNLENASWEQWRIAAHQKLGDLDKISGEQAPKDND